MKYIILWADGDATIKEFKTEDEKEIFLSHNSVLHRKNGCIEITKMGNDEKTDNEELN